MDNKILERIRENESEYHRTVMKYLKDKEEEIKTVLRRLDQKNNQSDGKDILISKLHNLVSKIEADGSALLGRLNRNEGELKTIRDNMDEMHRDKNFIVGKIKMEKRKVRQQANLIITLKGHNEQMKAAVEAKDKEIKSLEIKLLRAQNLAATASVKGIGTIYEEGESSNGNGPRESAAEDEVLDGVMITQRG